MEKKDQLPHKLAKPAQRALANTGITSLQQLSEFSEDELAKLHGIGQNALTEIKEAFMEKGLTFAKK